MRSILTWSPSTDLEAVERVHDDREEADQRDHDQLRRDAEAEPDHQDRGDHDHRERPGRRPRAGRPPAAARARGAARARSRRPPQGERKAEQHLTRGHPGVGSEQVTILARARSRPRSAPAAGSSRRGRACASSSQPPISSASSAAAPAHFMRAPPARAPSARRTRGEVTCSRRGRERSSATAQLGAHRARARARGQHPVAEEERLLDVVGDQQRRARLAPRARRRATPAARPA